MTTQAFNEEGHVTYTRDSKMKIGPASSSLRPRLTWIDPVPFQTSFFFLLTNQQEIRWSYFFEWHEKLGFRSFSGEDSPFSYFLPRLNEIYTHMVCKLPVLSQLRMWNLTMKNVEQSIQISFCNFWRRSRSSLGGIDESSSSNFIPVKWSLNDAAFQGKRDAWYRIFCRRSRLNENRILLLTSLYM